MFCLICLGLAVRLLFLQVVGGGWYAQRALGQQLRDTVVPADRGRITSADGLLLAANSSCWTLRASPREMPEDRLTLAAKGLSDLLALDEKKLLNGDVIDGIMMEDKKEVDKVILTGAELSKYFGKETTPREMKDQIIKLLDDWKGQQKEHEKPEKKTEQEK